MIDIIARNTDGVAQLLESILDGLASPRASSEERLDLLQRLENLFGRAVLTSGVADHQRCAQQWWSAQSRPETCVALSLLSLLHRLHLRASVQASTSTPLDPTAEMTASLTILQGLCLKDETSSKIVSRLSSISLILDITQASYWTAANRDSPAIAHAVDLLICVTMSSQGASHIFDTLRGEQVIRRTMERYATSDAGLATTTLITLEEVQHSAIAMKCAECLLLYASEQDDAGNRTIEAGHNSNFVDISVVEHFARKHRKTVVRSTAQRQWLGEEESSADGKRQPHRPSTANDRTANVIQRSRRARSMSPMKARDVLADKKSRDERRSRSPAKESASPIKSFPPPLLSVSPSKLPKGAKNTAPFSRRLHSLDVNAKVFLTPVRGHNDRGDQPSLSTESVLDDNLARPLRSPLKSVIGPSPAVRRAQERSASPEKNRRKDICYNP
jgi:hypothetical protein